MFKAEPPWYCSDIFFDIFFSVTELVRKWCPNPRQKKLANKNEVGIHFFWSLKSHWLKIWFSTLNLIQSGFEWSWKILKNESRCQIRGWTGQTGSSFWLGRSAIVQGGRPSDRRRGRPSKRPRGRPSDYSTLLYQSLLLEWCWDYGHRVVTPYRRQCIVWAATTVIFVQFWSIFLLEKVHAI